MIPENHKITAEHRDFWNSLQSDMLASNKKLTGEDSKAIIERSFVFSQFFRGCTSIELAGIQNRLGLKDYGYVILVEFPEQLRTNDMNITIDHFRLHHSIKKILYDKNCALGPLLTNRMIIVVSEDDILTEAVHREESAQIYHTLAQAIEKQYQFKITVAIGSMHSVSTIYPSLTDALFCLYHNTNASYLYYLDSEHSDSNSDFDYSTTENRFIESVRLRKSDAFDYFGLLMDWIRPLNDGTKRNKILELLVLTYHTLNLDNHSDRKTLDFAGIVVEMMSCSGDQLIEYGSQLFLYLTSGVKQQNSIDYTNHIVKATKEYMETHYAEDISLENMAEHVNISPQYFSKLIKKNTGFNFIDWLSMLRVRKAKELLTNSDYTVKEVCFMVGYKDPNYFSRIFKKRIGITPSEFVKANSLVNNKS